MNKAVDHLTEPALRLPLDAIRDLCAQYPVRELALFGSALGPDFNDESDIDFLIDFSPHAQVGFLTLAEIQEKLAALLDRPVDLVPRQGLKPVIRQAVLDSARVVYANRSSGRGTYTSPGPGLLPSAIS